MAVIQQIRNRAGILVAIIIGMALVAFILGDLLTSGGSVITKTRANVAIVNGKGISIDYLQQIINEQEELTKMQSNTNSLDEKTLQNIRQRAWNDMIQSLVLGREIERLGLAVSSDELYDMVSGEQPHPFIMQFFADPNTGIVNRVALNRFLKGVASDQLDDQQKMFWFYLEDLIYKERKTMKYNNLIGKGLYTTNLEAGKRNSELNSSVNFSYIVEKYNGAADSLISVSEAEIKNYYKEHKNEYKQEKTRDISYVVWEVVPSENDYKAAEEWINDIKTDLVSIDPEDAFQFARANSDIQPDNKNFADGELSSTLNDFAFSAELGSVYGPYFEEDSYKLAKLSKVSYLPDSVKASHILFTADQNSDVAAIQLLADSLKTLIENGADIAELARIHSADDISARDGGNLGWFKEGTMFSKNFTDSCFYGKTGNVKMTFSQQGLHIVKITKQSRPVKKVQVSVLARQVQASDETDQVFFGKASEFGAVNNTKTKFDDAIASNKAIAKKADGLKETDNGITGIDNSRELVRWAFTGSKGDVTTKVMQFDNKYVVAVIDDIKEDGFSPMEDVKATIENELRKEKQAEELKSKFADGSSSGTDLQSVASNLNLQVNSATNVRFSSYSISGLGSEPKLQAIALGMEEGEMSAPIAGNNGVYIIQIDTKDEPAESADYTFQKSQLNRTYSSRVNYKSMNVLNDLAGVEDNRINFF